MEDNNKSPSQDDCDDVIEKSPEWRPFCQLCKARESVAFMPLPTKVFLCGECSSNVYGEYFGLNPYTGLPLDVVSKQMYLRLQRTPAKSADSVYGRAYYSDSGTTSHLKKRRRKKSPHCKSSTVTTVSSSPVECAIAQNT